MPRINMISDIISGKSEIVESKEQANYDFI